MTRPALLRHSAVFRWLENVRNNPRLYANDANGLEKVIWGFYYGLESQGVIDPGPRIGNHFRDWLSATTTLKDLNCGWGRAIDFSVGERTITSWRKIFDLFFQLVDQYAELVPRVVMKADLVHDQGLKEPHLGALFPDKDSRPYQIELIRYAPTQMYHFRFISKNRIHDEHFLWHTTGEEIYSVDVAFALKEAVKTYRVMENQWSHYE